MGTIWKWKLWAILRIWVFFFPSALCISFFLIYYNFFLTKSCQPEDKNYLSHTSHSVNHLKRTLESVKIPGLYSAACRTLHSALKLIDIFRLICFPFIHRKMTVLWKKIIKMWKRWLLLILLNTGYVREGEKWKLKKLFLLDEDVLSFWYSIKPRINHISQGMFTFSVWSQPSVLLLCSIFLFPFASSLYFI